MTKEEFYDNFIYQSTLLRNNLEAMESFESFIKAFGQLRSDFVYYLRHLGFTSEQRIDYNNHISINPSYRDYLFYKEPICKLCGYVIATIEEATIDHIVPKSRGGKNHMSNKQLAHAKCNSLKGNAMISTLSEIAA